MPNQLIYKLIQRVKPAAQSGDTIVEVMISIAVVALAIGLAYSISGKNLAVGITAKERTQAVALVESQIESYNAANRTGSLDLLTIKNQNYHFCINNTDTATKNPSADPNNTVLGGVTGNAGGYDAHCVIDSKYYLDINYVQKSTGGSPSTSYGDSLAFTARWEQLGGGPDQIVTVYYRPW